MRVAARMAVFRGQGHPLSSFWAFRVSAFSTASGRSAACGPDWEQKIMRAQRATLIQVGSCRVTNALLLLLAQALDFLLQEALALLLLGVLGAPLLGATENAPFRAFPPTSSRRTLWSAPYIALPMDPLPRAARSRCCQPPSTSKSSCTALRTSKTSRQAGQRATDRAAGRRSAEKH